MDTIVNGLKYIFVKNFLKKYLSVDIAYTWSFIKFKTVSYICWV